jgi:hypothetical protein
MMEREKIRFVAPCLRQLEYTHSQTHFHDGPNRGRPATGQRFGRTVDAKHDAEAAVDNGVNRKVVYDWSAASTIIVPRHDNHKQLGRPSTVISSDKTTLLTTTTRSFRTVQYDYNNGTAIGLSGETRYRDVVVAPRKKTLAGRSPSRTEQDRGRPKTA